MTHARLFALSCFVIFATVGLFFGFTLSSPQPAVNSQASLSSESSNSANQQTANKNSDLIISYNDTTNYESLKEKKEEKEKRLEVKNIEQRQPTKPISKEITENQLIDFKVMIAMHTFEDKNFTAFIYDNGTIGNPDEDSHFITFEKNKFTLQQCKNPKLGDSDSLAGISSCQATIKARVRTLDNPITDFFNRWKSPVTITQELYNIEVINEYTPDPSAIG